MMMLLRQLSYAIKTQLKTPKARTHCSCNYVQLRLCLIVLRMLRRNLKAARLTELKVWN